jgi:hypothetical protein
MRTALLTAAALIIAGCNSEPTASHIQKNTVCLTAQQIDDLDRQNQRTFDQPSRGAANGLPPIH